MSPSSDHLANTVAKYAGVVAQHVVPLFLLPSGKRPVMVGTGFFVLANDAPYLVSAAHVLDHLLEPGALHYYVSPDKLRLVTGRVLHSDPPTGQGRNFDRIDVGVVEPVGEGLPPYPGAEKASLPEASLEPFSHPRSDKSYLIVGYPESRNRPNRHKRQLLSQASGFTALSATAAAY
jgi:hypothetical protein